MNSLDLPYGFLVAISGRRVRASDCPAWCCTDDGQRLIDTSLEPLWSRGGLEAFIEGITCVNTELTAYFGKRGGYRFHSDGCWADVVLDGHGKIVRFTPDDKQLCETVIRQCAR